jgi:peptide/nickel transport system substrate-binding protein
LKRSKSKLAIVALSIFLLAVIVLSACSAPKQTGPASTSAGPKYGGTLHLAYIQDITFFDSAKSLTLIDRALPFLYGNTLVKWSGKNDEDLKVVPSLATKWDIAPDGLSYTFYLRKGVKFQNLPPVNGREFVANDVKFSIEHVLDPKTKSPLTLYFMAIDSIETPDNYTVKFNLRMPDPYFMFTLCGTSIGAHEVAEQDGDLNKTLIGTGPFMLEKYTPGVGISFKRNPDYWETGKPYLDRVECTYITDPSQRLAAFRAGQLDRVAEGKSNTDAIRTSVPTAKIVPGINIQGSCLSFSLKQTDKPWADKKVRQALQYAIDYDGLIQAVLNGSGSRTDYLAPSFADWGARKIQDLPKYNIAKAKAMLADAGYANGFKTTIVQHTNRMDAWGGAVEPLAAQLKAVGIDAQIIPAAQADFVSKTRAGDYDLAGTVLLCAAPDPDGSLSYMYRTKAAYNRSQYSNPVVDDLLDKQRKSVGNVSERQGYVKQIMAILADDVPVIPLFYQFDFSITQPWVHGWENAGDPSTSTAWYEVANVWLDKK